MKKILILLYMMMCCAIGITQAQTIYVNTPDTVCISTASASAGQTKYLSVNAMVVTSNRYKVTEQASWKITGPTGSDADYEVLYTGNTGASTKLGKLQKTKSLTLQFMVPGWYDVEITLPYTDNGAARTQVIKRRIRAEDCTINTCGTNEANDKPGFFEDFGTIPGTGIVRQKYPINGVVTYDFQGSGDLADNYYSISNSTYLKGDWVNNTDHTGGGRGGMLVANSHYDPRIMYQKTVTGLCKGSVYNFSAWLININPIGVFENGCVSGYKYAGVTFVVVDSDNPTDTLANFPTYNVSMDLSNPKSSWQKYGGSFTIPSNVESVKVIIVNNKPGGCGNDIAIDDIEFAYCSPNITASIKGKTDNLAEVVCEGAPITLTSAYTPTDYFVNPRYQWEMSDDEGLTYVNVPFGTATSKELVIGPGELKGTRTVSTSYRFRVRIYEAGSDAVSCASPSEYVRLTILPMPTLYLTKSQVCAGAFVELQASGGFDRFLWADLPGFEGPKRTIQVIRDSTITVYGYVDYADGHTCVDSNKAFISSVDNPVVDVISTSQNICAGSSVDIRINDALAGYTIEWYQGPNATTGVLLPQYTNKTFLSQVQINTPAQGIFTVVVRDPANVCKVESAPFVVTVTPIPIANAGPDQVACASINTTGNFTMAAALNTGESGVWTIDSLWGPGVTLPITAADFKDYATVQFPNLRNSRVTLKKGGITVSFKWTVKSTANNACSSSDAVQVSLLFDPSNSDAGPDTTLCGTNNVFTMNASQPDLTLTGPYAETGTWKLVSGNATIADIHAYNTTVTSLVNEQDIVLTWKITNAANCTPNEDTVILHKTTRPVINLRPGIIACNSNGTFQLDTLSTKGNPDTYSITAGTPALPGFVAITDQPITAWPMTINYPVGTPRGVYNFNLSYRNSANAGCDSTVPFSVSVQAPPVAPTGIAASTPNICTSGNTTLTVVGGSLGQNADGTPNGNWVWYAGGCGAGAPIGTGPSITVAVSATTTYYVRAEPTGACTNTACASTTVTVYQMPTAANAGPDQAQCNIAAFTMAANAASVGTGTWTVTAPGTITAGQQNSRTAVINVPAGNSVVATWTITNGVCTTSDAVTLRNDAQPTGNAGADIRQCNNSSFTMASTITGTGTGKWTVASGTATIPTTDSAKTNAVITVPVGTSATLVWTVTNGTCTSVDNVVLTNFAQPTANAGADIRQCNTSTFTMASSITGFGTGKWTVASGTATIPTTDSAKTNAIITVPVGTSATLVWTVTNGACTSVDNVVLTNFAQPTANAGADIRQCNNSTFTMASSITGTGTGKWTVASGTATIPTTDSAKTNAVITVPVGTSATLVWTVTNGACTSVDNVVLTNYAQPTANAGADIRQCNTSTFTMASSITGFGTGKWTVASGTATIPTTDSAKTNAVITVPVGTTATLVWTVTNGVCTSVDNVVLTNFAQPTANAGADIRQCNNSTFTMASTITGTGTGKWTVASGTATIPTTDSAKTNAVITVPVGTSATLVWTVTNGACTSVDNVVLTNYAQPTANAGADISQCNNSSFTMASTITGFGTGKWTVAAGTATIPTTDSTKTNAVITVPVGTTATLTWTVTNGVCTSADNVVLTNFAQPTANAGADIRQCNNSTFTMASTITGTGTGKWTVAAGSVATIPTTDSAKTNAVITVPVGTSATLVWTVTNGACTSVDNVVLTNFAQPTANAGADIRQCNNSTFTMASTITGTGTGKWTVTSGTAAIPTTDSAKTNAIITVPVGTTATLTWTVTNGTCTSVDNVVLTNYAQPTANAGADIRQCNNSTFTMASTITGTGTGKWTVASGTATIPTTDSTKTNAVITVPVGTSATLVWTVTNGTCTSVDNVVLTNYAQPTANAGADIRQCNNSTFTMASTITGTGTGKWTVASGTATIPTTDSAKTNAVITVPVGTSATLVWTVTNGACTSVDNVVLTNFAQPTANAGTDISQCNNSTFTMASTITGFGTGKWTVASGTATIPTTDSAKTNAIITVPVGASATLVWTVTNGACTSVDNVVLTNFAQPTANAGADIRQCNNSTFTMASTITGTGTGKWTVASGTATIPTTDSAKTNAVITVPVGTSATLVWTVTNGTCTSVDNVVLTNYAQPTANAGTDISQCNNSSFTMASSITGFGTGKWTVASGTATIPTTDSTKTNAVITVAVGTSATLVWTVTNGACTSTDNVVLTNYAQPTANAGADIRQCNISNFTMASTITGTGTGKWTVAAGSVATIPTTDSAKTNAVITVAVGTSASLVWTVTNGTCISRDTVVLSNFTLPTANAGPDLEHCNDASFPMTAAITGTGTGKWTLVPGTTASFAVTDSTNANAVINVPAGVTVKAVWNVTNGSCIVTDTVVLTNYVAPTPAAAGPDQEKCNDPAFTMAANVATAGVGKWSLVPGTTASFAVTDSTNRAAVINVPTGVTVDAVWTIQNGLCITRDTVRLTNYEAPVAANAGPDQEECNNTSTFTLAANTPSVAGATGTWSVVSPAGFTFPAGQFNNPTASITIPAGTVLTLRWTITNGLCTTTDDVVLTNYAEPDVADAGPDQAKCAGTDFVTAANAPTVPGAVGTWTIVAGAATIKAGEENMPIAHITVPNGGSATLRWTIKNGLCENFDEVDLTNYLTPSPANAGPDQRDCNIPTFTMSANAPDVPGATGTWTLAAGSPGTITPGDENKPDAVINVPTGATVTAIWTITNGTCPSVDTVLLTNDEMPAPAVAGPDQEKCNDAAFTMAANAPSVGVGKWSLTPGTTASFAVADSSNINAVINVPAGVTVTATWTITNGSCVTSDDVVLTNYVAPAPAVAGPDQEKCNTPAFTMAAAAPSVGVGKWSLVPGSTASFAVADSTNRAAVINVPVGESVQAVWTITNGVCETKDTVRLTNYVAPAPAAAGPDQAQCNTPAFTMAANTPSVGVGKWSLPAGSTASFAVADSTNPNAIITVPAGVTVTATWTITNGVCTTSDNVTLTNYEQPTPADAGPHQEHCNDPVFRMAANRPSVGVGKWSLSAGTTASFAVADSTNPNAVINVPVGVTVTATWTITNGTCTTTDDVTLTNHTPPAPANAGPDMTHCDDDRFVMAANTPTVGTGIWSLPAGTTASIAAADWNNPNAVITVPAGVVVTATWTITNGSCTTVDNVILTNHEMPSNAVAGADQTHCDDPNFTMSANVPSPATAVGTWTIISGAATIADIHSPSTRVTVPSGGTVTLRWTITNGTCTSTPDDVVLTNQAAILGNTITADQLLCANQTPAMLQGATLSGGNGTFTYQWQVSTTSATTGFVNVAVNGTNATFTPPMITQNTWYRRVVMSGACTGNISNAVMLTLMNIPPVVISVPGPLTVDCVQGTDYTTKFGTPVFSHAPYNNEPLTVTHNDVTTTVDACTFTIQRTWTAMDRCGLTTQAQQTITVIDRTAPVFTGTAPANVTVDCDKVPAPVNLTANDACTGVLNIVPIEVRINQPGACASNYQLIRKWVAVDACGNASDTLRQVITVRDMTPPVFNNPAPANITVDCDKVPAGQPLTANDNCTPGVITVMPVDVRKNLSGSRCADNYQIIRTWTATDLCGNKTVLTQTITVQDTIKPRFSMSLPPAITVDCDKVPAVATITATDNCTVTVAVKVSEKKEFLSTVCTSNYRLTRTWTAVDNCGNTATMQQVITVQDTTRPVFTVMPPADTTVSCDAIPTPPTNLSARDNCSTVKISYTQTRETIPGACASNYRLIRIWTAKDQCNNTNTIRQVITVTDTTKPVIDPAPANVTLNCGEAVPAAATLYARDNCDATFPKKATMTQDPFVVDLCAGYTIVRRWRIADACGNQAIERVQTITVNPCPKPALDPNMPANCSNNTRFAVMLQNKVSKPKFTLVSVVPASAVRTPLTQSSNVFDLKGATQATFIVTDGVTGCVSDPITYDLQYVMKPVVDLGTDVAICEGSSVTLDAGIDNAAYTIRWSTGASTQTIDVTAAGTYSVTVSNGICTTTDAINVTVNMPPVVNIPDTAICMGETVTLKAYVQGATYVWSTGETTASIDVTTSGTYSVDVTLKGCTTHEEATVTVGTPPVITLTDDSEICPNETLMLTVEPDGGNVRWSTGETTNSIVVTKAGNYEVTVTRDGCMVTDKVAVTERPDLDIDLGPDREFCTGGRVVVDATHPDAISYLWNDGETTPIREIVLPGKYVVSVMDRFCSRITMDSVNVTVAGIPETLLPADTTLCIGEDLTLKVNAGIGNTIRWQDGSSGATYKVTGPGTYTVTVSNECGAVTDNIVVRYQPCEAKPQFPNGFTPNGDGHNDIFKPVVRGPMYDYDLRIYNRWGELIFLSKDQKNGWDGRYKGALVENGTYVWMLSYKKVLGGAVNIVKGEVTAIR